MGISKTEGSNHDVCDLMQVKLDNQPITFLSAWANVLGTMQTSLLDSILESLFYQQVHRSQSLRARRALRPVGIWVRREKGFDPSRNRRIGGVRSRCGRR